MPESIARRTNAIPDHFTAREMRELLLQVQADLAAINARLNTHVHSGITAGGANSGAPTTTGAIGTTP